jgi:hypothetical protein
VNDIKEMKGKIHPDPPLQKEGMKKQKRDAETTLKRVQGMVQDD